MTESRISVAMHQLLNQPNPTLEESIFVKKYLPLLAANTSEVKAPVGLWLEVAGTAFQPVDIVKGKEILFTVPALLDSNSVKIQDQKDRRALTIPGMIAEAEMRTATVPQMGINFLNHHLSKLFEGRELHSEHLLAWQAIFKRYNIKPFELPTELSGEAPSSSQEMTFDEFEDI